MKPQVEDTKPWYKQAWPWFLIALPSSAVIAGIATIIIATNNADSLVKDDYYKEGLAINQSIGRQKTAQSLALSFILIKTDDGNWQITTEKELNSKVLYLQMQHPVDEKKDLTLVFNKINEKEYIAKHDLGMQTGIFSVNYRINLSPADKQWEILDRWNPKTSQIITIKAQTP